MKKIADLRQTDFYRWVIAVISFLMMFVSLGLCNAPNGLYIQPVTSDMGFTRGAFSFVFSLRFIFTTIINTLFGVFVFRFGIRWIVFAGFLFLSATFTVFSYAGNIQMFYIGGCLLGIGLACSASAACAHLVNSWFTEKKGIVLGVVFAASGFGGAFFNILVEKWISSYGWQISYRITAVLVIAVGIIVVLLVREKPHDAKTVATTKQAKYSGKTADWAGFSVSQLVKMPYFYGVAFFVFLTGVINNPIYTIAPAHLIDTGFDPAFAASIAGLLFAVLAITKIMIGKLYDHIGLKATVYMCLLSNIVAILTLAFVSSKLVAVIYTLAMGIALPLETLVIPMIVSDMLGQTSYPTMVGIFFALSTAGIAVGNPVMNFGYDIVGSYMPVLMGFLGVVVIAMVIFFVCDSKVARYKLEQKQELLINAKQLTVE